MLPKIPYSMEKNKSMTVPIGNLNFSSNFKPGDIAESYGISARKYPRLTNRKTEKKVLEGVSGEILGMTVFNGQIVTVRTDPMLANTSAIYVGDQRVHDLQGQQKRKLTAINTKLVIYPDKVYLERIGEAWRIKNLWARINSATEEDLKAKFTSNNSLAIYNYSWEFSGCGAVAGSSDSAQDGYDSFSGYLASHTRIEQACLVHAKGYIIAGKLYTIESTNVKYNVKDNHYYFRSYLSPSTYDLLNNADSILCISEDGLFKWNDFKIQKSSEVYGSGVEGYYVSGTVSKDCHWYSAECEVGMTSSKEYLIYAFYSPDDGVFSEVRKDRHVTLSTLKGERIISGYVEVIKNYIIGLRVTSSSKITEADAFFVTHSGWLGTLIESISTGDRISFNDSNEMLTVSEVKIQTDDSSFTITFSNPSSLDFSVEEEKEITIFRYVTTSEPFLEFKEGDAVTISGSSVKPEAAEEAVSNDTTFVIYKIKDNAIYASSDIFTPGTSLTTVTIERKVPDLDFICEKDNRLYGVNNTEKTIYVSALGDPTNMYAYEGVSTDSFAVPVGGEGIFTGCCKYGESVLFFKEDKIYKLVGSYPAEFALYSYDVDGLQDGADKSPVVINEVLYYKGKNGIFAYKGGVPTLISENFGERVFSDAVGGSDGVCYYLAVKGEEKKNNLLSFNTRLGLWVLEDSGGENIIDFVRTSAGLHYATEIVKNNEVIDGEVYLMNASDDVSELEWMVQFVPFYETIEGKKTYSRLLMRVEIPRGSYMIIEVRSDGGAWREAGKIVGAHNRVIPIRLPIARCDKFEIRLRGKGEFSILDILREYHVGSEV